MSNLLDDYLRKALEESNDNDDPKLILPFEAAQALINAVKQAAVIEDKYWDIHQISKFIGVSTSTVQRHFINDPRWPKPILYGNPKQQTKRWLASECKKALLLFRSKK